VESAEIIYDPCVIRRVMQFSAVQLDQNIKDNFWEEY
jgi:hypothetical protein